MQVAEYRQCRKDITIITVTEDQMDFIEELGVLFEESGAAPMIGRIYGALLISPETELTAEDLTTILHASRGAISQATRQLVEMGMIRRMHKPGMRKDFFQLTQDGFVEVTRLRITKISSIRDLFQRGLDSMPDASANARDALQQNLEFIDYWDAFIVDFFKGWQERKKELGG